MQDSLTSTLPPLGSCLLPTLARHHPTSRGHHLEVAAGTSSRVGGADASPLLGCLPRPKKNRSHSCLCYLLRHSPPAPSSTASVALLLLASSPAPSSYLRRSPPHLLPPPPPPSHLLPLSPPHVDLGGGPPRGCVKEVSSAEEISAPLAVGLAAHSASMARSAARAP